mgnify:CR=1 FL=1
MAKPICPIHIQILTNNRKECQNIYKILVNNTTVLKAETKWQAELALPEHFEWRKVHGILNKLTRDPTLKWFQYRLHHIIIATNTLLTKNCIKNSDLCTFCNLHKETLMHLFCDCEIVKDF